MNREVAGRPPGPRACRRHGARRLIICAARTGRSLTARARRRLSGGNCDCGRGALRSVVLLEKQAGDVAGAGATPHDRGGRGDRVHGRRRRLWSSSSCVRSDCCGRRHVDGRQRAAVASARPHWPQCERGAARAGDPPHPWSVVSYFSRSFANYTSAECLCALFASCRVF